MAREKKPVHKVQMTEGKREIIQKLLQEYEIQSAQDIQEALKDLLGGTIKEMMEAEMDSHLGYQKSERSDRDDYRNGYKSKQVNSSYGSMEIEVPQDRKSTFQPQVVKKRQKDISDIDQKIISMYAKLQAEELHKAIEQLTEKEKRTFEVIAFAVLQGISEREMAVYLGIPQKTLNCRKQKIFNKLKKYFAQNK